MNILIERQQTSPHIEDGLLRGVEAILLAPSEEYCITQHYARVPLYELKLMES